MLKLANSNVNNKKYSEAAALQQLLESLDKALEVMNSDFEQSNDYDYLNEQITITIGGISTAFLLGGPQAQAIYVFVQHIAEENGYSVDVRKNTVIE